MMMPDDGGRIQVRPIALCMTVADNTDVVIVRYRRTDGRIDTGVSRPAGDNDAIRCNAGQDVLQLGSNERIVQCLVDHGVVSLKIQFGQK